MRIHVLPLLIVLSSCTKKEPAPVFTLPPITQTGANTMGFKINGRVWQSFGKNCQFSGCIDSELGRTLYYNADKKRTDFRIYTFHLSKEYHEDFTLSIDSIVGTGTYKSGTTKSYEKDTNRLYFSNLKTNLGFSSRGAKGSTILISRYDTINKIISGTFYGRLINYSDTTKNISITDGRFDVQY